MSGDTRGEIWNVVIMGTEYLTRLWERVEEGQGILAGHECSGVLEWEIIWKWQT